MTEHVHRKLGLRLVLAEAEDLRQRDVERYMAAYREQKKLGDSVAEAHGKSLRAALMARWVKAIESGAGANGTMLNENQVGDLPPAAVRWFAQKVDALYLQITLVPDDVIMEAAGHGEDPKSEPAAA